MIRYILYLGRILLINNKDMTTKRLVNKAVWVREDTMDKLKTLASMENQSLSEWVTWVIDRAYEAKVLTQRGHLNVESLLEKEIESEND